MPAETTMPLEVPGSAVVPAEAVTPLIRGVGVVRELTEAGGTLSLSGLERATGLARSTVDRITSTLARMGYVRLDGRDAVLTPRLMELGNAYLAALRLPALLSGRADALADELDESVSLAVADRDGIRFIHQATRRRAMSLSFRIGDLLPAERTAPGPLFASEWTPADWQTWHERRASDPEDRGFPAVPPRGRPGGGSGFGGTGGFAGARGSSAGRGPSTARDASAGRGLPAAQSPSAAPGSSTAPDSPEAQAHSAAQDSSGAPSRELPHPDAEFEQLARDAGRDGWALDDQLIEPGLVAVSVPVREGRTGRIACVVSVVSHTSRHSATDLRDTLLPRLRATVAEMERVLASTPQPAPGAAPSGLASWTGASKHELGRDFVESLARGLTVLTAFGAGRSALTLTDVAQATGLARATARRALITYEHLGLVRQQPESRTFSLTPRVLSLGFPPLSRTSLPRIATPHLTDLSARVGESTALAILSTDRREIQYTARAVSHRIMGVDIRLGTRLPASATSLGWVLLSDTKDTEDTEGFEEVRAQGYALLDEDWEEGLRTLAVPLHDRTGRVVAAVNVALHAAGRTARECVEQLLPELRLTATRIERELHAAGHFTRVSLL